MGWFVNVFNKYDGQRVAEVGPDRACAEWLLRGAGLPARFCGIHQAHTRSIYTISGERPSVCDSVTTNISSLQGYLGARV